MQKIKLIPLKQRARNRVQEHGNVFNVRQELEGKIYVECICPQHIHSSRWFGWFTSEEALWERED